MSETRGLGRGLSSLIGDVPARTARDGLRKLPVGELRPSPYQPRSHFDEEELDALAESIQRHGLVQPILARPAKDGNGYEIVAGERRWRAAQRAKIHEIPVVVREIGDSDVMQLALIENLQRTDLNALEEAQAYKRLVEEFGFNHSQIARGLGKSRPQIANTLRLLELPEAVRALLGTGKLSAGHARALIGAPEAAALARTIVEQGLSVRETERLVADGGGPKGRGGRGRKKDVAAPDADVRDLEKRLAERTGLKVTVRQKGEGGELVLAYRNLDQLDDVIARLEAPARPRLVQS